jgi:hypothetical protein
MDNEEFIEDEEVVSDDSDYPTIESFKTLNETLKELGLKNY